MRKITFLSLLFLLTGWLNTWAQTLVSDVASLTDGTIVALQCRDTNGGAGYYFNGNAIKSQNLSYANLYMLRAVEGGVALQSMWDGTYIGKDDTALSIKLTKAEAAPFTTTIVAATNWTTVMEGTQNGTYTVRFTTNGTHLNTRETGNRPNYATGTGGFSVWYVYTFTAEEAAALQPYMRFASYNRGGYLSKATASDALQHNSNFNYSFWKVYLCSDGNGVKLYNAAKKQYLASNKSFSDEPAAWYLPDNPWNAGCKVIATSSNYTSENVCIDANNYNDGLGDWKPSSTDFQGTSWRMESVKFPDYLTDIVNTQIGTNPGYIDAENEKIAAATEFINNLSSKSTFEDYMQAYETMNAGLQEATRKMPEAGKYYEIVSAFSNFTNEMAIYNDGTALMWKSLATLKEEGRKYIYQFTPNGDGTYNLQNFSNGKYFNSIPYNQDATSADEPSPVTLTYLNVPGQFNIVVGEQSAHTKNHNNGTGTGGTIIGWPTGANGASAWYIREIPAPENIVINNATVKYVIGGNVVKTETGVTFNEATFTYNVPDFVSLEDLSVNEDATPAEVTATFTSTLPFTPSTSYETAVWQVLDMHSNDLGNADVYNGINRYVWTFVAENEDVILPELPSIDVNNGYMNDNRRWAFVGNPFDGFKIYNKAAGQTLTLRKAENGNTAAVMSSADNRNVFKVFNTTAGIENSFALKIDGDSYYVNTQKGNDDSYKMLRGWNAADGGSSCRVFEPVLDVQNRAFYRIKGKANSLYLTTGTSGSRMPMIGSNETAASIFYINEEGKLINYGSGLCPYHTSQTGNVGEANTWKVKEDGDAYTLYVNTGNVDKEGRWLYNHNTGQSTEANRNSVTAGNNTRWILEAVTELPVNVTEAGYATLYAPVSLTIPADVEVYYGKINSENQRFDMTQLQNIVPANTPVVIKANAGSYKFAITDETGTEVSEEVNDMSGTVLTMAKPDNTYTLQFINNTPGFYEYTGTNVNGFKAYLTMTTTTTLRGLSFFFGNQTGIEGIETKQNTDSTVFDLSGRRVLNPTKGGIYIKNGKKVLVK